MANWLTVAPLAAASSRRAATRAPLRSRFSLLKRGIRARMSPACVERSGENESVSIPRDRIP